VRWARAFRADVEFVKVTTTADKKIFKKQKYFGDM
jgi:hypothetical protein